MKLPVPRRYAEAVKAGADQFFTLAAGRQPSVNGSGYTKDAMVQRGVLDEGVRLLTKPFGLEALAQAVRQILDGVPEA